MSDDLFAALDEKYRRRLRAAGWHECGGLLRGGLMWRTPEGVTLDEPEAMARAERMPPLAEEVADG